MASSIVHVCPRINIGIPIIRLRVIDLCDTSLHECDEIPFTVVAAGIDDLEVLEAVALAADGEEGRSATRILTDGLRGDVRVADRVLKCAWRLPIGGCRLGCGRNGAEKGSNGWYNMPR